MFLVSLGGAWSEIFAVKEEVGSPSLWVVVWQRFDILGGWVAPISSFSGGRRTESLLIENWFCISIHLFPFSYHLSFFIFGCFSMFIFLSASHFFLLFSVWFGVWPLRSEGVCLFGWPVFYFFSCFLFCLLFVSCLLFFMVGLVLGPCFGVVPQK